MRGLHTHFPPHEPYIFANLLEGPCMNALHTMQLYVLFTIDHLLMKHRPGRLVYIPPPLYVNTVYKSHLQLNAEPHSYLHCACVWEYTTHWHTVSDMYVKLCTGVTYCIIHTVISENKGWKVCVYVCTYHPPIHFIAPTTIPVLSPVLFMPSLYYTSYNSKNFFIY